MIIYLLDRSYDIDIKKEAILIIRMTSSTCLLINDYVAIITLAQDHQGLVLEILNIPLL